MGHRAGAALLHRQARLSAVKSLDLALLVNREDDGMIGRIDIEPDDILELGRESRIVGELELAHLVGFEAVRAPGALDRGGADSNRLGHGRRGPVGHLARRRTCGEVDHLRDHRLGERRLAGRARLVAQQAVHPGLHEAFLPAPDHRFALACLPHDLGRAEAVRRQHDNSSTPNMLLRAISISDDRRKSPVVDRFDVNHDSRAHAQDSHSRKSLGIHRGLVC